MTTLGRKPLQLITAVFAEHKEFVKQCREWKNSVGTNIDPALPTLATAYLKMLASPNGNDILEEVCVKATGREPKEDVKHGADSKDGELEAKPMKTGYNAHISDDTPASLLRHQTIPYICLAEWSKDGAELLWAITTSYRIFDAARYRGILATLSDSPANHGLAPELPTTVLERRAALEALVVARERLIAERNIPRYVRSNPLPIEALASLQRGQYTIWADPKLETSRGKAHRILWDLWKRQCAHESQELDEAFVSETEAIREYFSSI